jgi:dehydrogenase/reductase SDR family protein 12
VSGLFRRVADKLASASLVFSYGSTGHRIRSGMWDDGDLVDMTSRRCLVTGGNAGIGYAAARALSALGATVTLVARDSERAQRAVAELSEVVGADRVDYALCDMSDLSQVASLGESMRRDGRPIDVLVHNAGVLLNARRASVDGNELTFATNVLGGHLLTHRLTPLLAASPVGGRVVHVSSGGMYARRLDVDALIAPREPFDGVAAYAQTKRAQVVLSELWAERLAAHGVTSNAMHPGWAATPGVARSLPRFDRLLGPILRTPEQGADTVVWLAAAASVAEESGAFYFDRARRPTHLLPGTRESAAERTRLWETCEALVAGHR